MREKKHALVTRIVELESRLQSQNDLYAQEMWRMIAKEQELNSVKQELAKKHIDQLDELQVRHEWLTYLLIWWLNAQVQHTQEMDKQNEKHELEINNVLRHHNKILGKQYAKSQRDTMLITKYGAECEKLCKDLAAAGQQSTNLTKYVVNDYLFLDQ